MNPRTSPKLDVRRVGLFCTADFGFNLYYSGLSIFLLYYYTDIVGIRPATAGLIFAIPLLWDAITDPIMGAIASRVPSRHGRFRVFLLFGSVPLALSFVLMFVAPLVFTAQVALAAALTHIVFRTAYTVVTVPYSALSANMVLDTEQRGSLAGMRMICATTGGLFTVLVTLPLANAVGGGDLRLGFVVVATLYAIISTLLTLLAFQSTAGVSATSTAPQLAFGDIGRVLLANRALLILVAAVVLGATGVSVFSKMLIYFVKYVADVDLPITAALVSMTGMAAISIPVWMAISRKLEKKTVWIIGGTAAALGQIALYVIPPAEGTMVAILLAIGFANGAFYVTFWSMLPDTVEYGQWRSASRDEGLVFGINLLALKAAAGMGIGALGFLLDASGFVAGVEQAPETLARLEAITTLVPASLMACAMAVIAFYPISKRKHRQMVVAIERREARPAPAGEGHDT
ncbi:MAG: glycoside-pentoside-hexuronide (GPH):cation symporter [Pseudomonadota bacterium]